jgi:flagella basal body P-ring formation protein FlgA
LTIALALGLTAAAAIRPAFSAGSNAASPTRILSKTEIADELKFAVEGENTGQTARIILNETTVKLRAPAVGPALLAVEKLDFDKKSGHFSAILISEFGEGAFDRARLDGRAVSLRSMPVPNRRIAAGEVITEADLDWLEVPAGRAESHVIADVASVVGKTPRRPLSAGQLMRTNDVQRPEMVTKGSPVTMVLESPGLLLTVSGRALNGGAEGDTISVLNTQSKQTVEATVVAPNQVSVQSRTGIVLSAR